MHGAVDVKGAFQSIDRFRRVRKEQAEQKSQIGERANTRMKEKSPRPVSSFHVSSPSRTRVRVMKQRSEISSKSRKRSAAHM